MFATSKEMPYKIRFTNELSMTATEKEIIL
jgi:hypothetical protein